MQTSSKPIMQYIFWKSQQTVQTVPGCCAKYPVFRVLTTFTQKSAASYCEWDLATQLSRPRPRPWHQGLETLALAPRSRDRDFSKMNLSAIESRDLGLKITTLLQWRKYLIAVILFSFIWQKKKGFTTSLNSHMIEVIWDRSLMTRPVLDRPQCHTLYFWSWS